MLVKNAIKFVLLASIAASVFIPELYAQEQTIPLAEKIVEDTEDMDVFEILKFIMYGVGGVILAGLGITGVVVSGNAALQAFNEWRAGKVEFGEMFMKLVVALVVLALVFVLIGYGYTLVEK